MRLVTGLLCFIFAPLLLAEPLPSAAPESVGISGSRLEKISEFAARHIAQGKHSGMVTMVARQGKIVHFEAAGQIGVANDAPMKKDTLFRIFSMTKPVTSVAMMILYEEGRFKLNDPVSKYLPELAALKVLNDGQLQDATSPMLIQHLFTHTAGFSYGFVPDDPVDNEYREADLWNSKDLDQLVLKVASLPLRFEPGEFYYYSIATDLIGAIVERLSGQTLEAFFEERIFQPLGMHDTYFSVPEDKRSRLADNHIWNYELNRLDPLPDTSGNRAYRDTTLFSGGGGLSSTAADYYRFCQMMLNKGELDGVRLISRKTAELMTADHVGDSSDTVSFGYGFEVVDGRKMVVDELGSVGR